MYIYKYIYIYIYICIYTLNPQLRNLNKYKDTGYSIRFDSRSEFLSTDGSFGKNATIFGADMSLSVHIHNREEDNLILVEGPTQGLDDTTLTAKPIYPLSYISFTQPNKRFV